MRMLWSTVTRMSLPLLTRVLKFLPNCQNHLEVRQQGYARTSGFTFVDHGWTLLVIRL